MFCLNDSMRYFLCRRPTDMRKSFHTLSGIVQNTMGLDPYGGDVFIFVNKPRNRIKLLHWESGGLVLYSKILDVGTVSLPPEDKTASSTSVEWRDLVLMVEGIIEKKDSRKERLETLKNLRKN